MENLKFFGSGESQIREEKRDGEPEVGCRCTSRALALAFFFVSARHARRVKRPESSDFGNTHASPVFPLVWRLSACRSGGPAWRWTVARRLSRKEATLLFPTRLAAARRKQGRSFLSSGSPPRRIRQETRHALSPPTSPLLRKNSKQGSSTRKSFFFAFLFSGRMA